MPKGPRGEKRPADVIANAVKVMKIATGEIEEEIDTPEKEGKDPAAKGVLNRIEISLVAVRLLGRSQAQVSDACERALTGKDHHDWVEEAANRLLVKPVILWQGLRAT